ncbi:MAG: MipA/OmpV family protein [Bdellovibrionota bacterium]|nr:MipA/OmpV family protein [Bdellovibrionota bacterium]
MGDEALPKYELGIGIGDLYLPDYPAADQNTNYLIPFPFFVYRGDWIEADRDEGIRSKLFSEASIELNLSFGGGFPVDSSKNTAREGMPDLDWMYQFGPSLIYRLALESSSLRWSFHLPLRFVGSTSGKHTEEQGILLNPKVQIQNSLACKFSCQVSFVLGANLATQKLNQYFYSVEQEFVSSSRPFYNAEAGYLSGYLSLRFTTHYHKNRWGLTFTYANYSSSANEDSPLFKSKESRSLSIYYARDLWKANTIFE